MAGILVGKGVRAMQLDDLEKRENLSTEEIIQIASKLSCDEVLHCSVPIMPIIRLVAHLHDKSCRLNATSINLEVLNPEQMRFGIVFQVHPTTVQNARIVGRSLLDPGILNVEDLVNIFGLDASAKWQVHKIYKTM